MKTLLPPMVLRGQVIVTLALCAFGWNATATAAGFEDRILASGKLETKVECTTPDGRVAPLPMGDETLSCALQEGRTTFVIQLPGSTLLDHLTFVNENAAAAGDLKISVSNDQLPASSAKWVDVDGRVAFNHKRLFNLSMVGVEARYVRLDFNVANAGRIAAADLSSGRTLDHSIWKKSEAQQFGLLSKTTRTTHRTATREYDYAALRARAYVTYVSSGSLAESRPLIDGKIDAGFRFAKNDPHPTAIVELAGDEEIYRVSARYTAHTPGRLDVYLLNDMGKSATDLKYLTPIASVADEDGAGEAAVDIDPQGVRYVAVRFTPVESFANDRAPFEMIEIDAFGGGSPAIAEAMEAPDLYAVDYTAAPFPGQSNVEISTSLGTLAIPPTIPNVSP